jgi:GTP cyclohydrolase I
MADRERAAKAIEDFLAALGFSATGELEGTPRRVADAWLDELVSGQGKDPLALLRSGRIDLGDGPHGAVVVRDVALATMCPHHLLPSHGRATVGILPGRFGVGLGVVAELVDALSRRMTLQETLCEQIADAAVRGLDAQGAFCRISLVHTCFVARGERQAGASVDTLAFAGSFLGADRPLALVLAGGDVPSPSNVQA